MIKFSLILCFAMLAPVARCAILYGKTTKPYKKVGFDCRSREISIGIACTFDICLKSMTIKIIIKK